MRILTLAFFCGGQTKQKSILKKIYISKVIITMGRLTALHRHDLIFIPKSPFPYDSVKKEKKKSK